MVLDRVGEVLQRVLAPAQDQGLGGEDRVGVARAGPPAELEALAREPLRVLDAARHLRPHHLPADREVAVERLAQVGGERREAAVRGARLVHARGLEQVVDAPVVGERLQLRLAQLLREREQLFGQPQPLVHVVDVQERAAAGLERGHAPARVAEPLGHRERLLAQRLAALRLARELQPVDQPGAQLDGHQVVAASKRGEGLLEQRQALVVDHARLGVAAREAERGLRERVVVLRRSAAALNVARACGSPARSSAAPRLSRSSVRR